MTLSSTPLNFNFTPTNPSLRDLLNKHKQNIGLTFNCHHIGTIQSFNASNQTATVSINYQKVFYVQDFDTGNYVTKQVPYPLLVNSPVIVLGGGPTCLTFPIAQGDECLVLFNDRDIDLWFQSGQTTLGPNTLRLHSYSDAMILVGVRSLLHSLVSVDSVRAVLRAGLTSGSITAVGVNPSSSKVLITNTYPDNTTTLNTLLQQLVTEVKNLVNATAAITVSEGSYTVTVASFGTPTPVTGTSGSPTNASTISAIATDLTNTATAIGGLLE